MKMMTWETAYDILRDHAGVSTEALDLAFTICGCNMETAKKVLYATTGWGSFDGYIEELKDEYGIEIEVE